MTSQTLLGTIARTDDETAVVAFDRRYATDAADLWTAVTDPERIARWFAPVTGDLTEGGTFAITFDDGDVPQCRITACDAPRSFHWEWPQGGQVSHVEVEVVPDGDASRLRLTHTRLPLDKAPEYGAGWNAFVGRLDDYLAGREVSDTWFQDFDAAQQGYADQLA